MQPIEINYTGTLMKSRNRQMMKAFVYRFYTPFSFIVWFMVALNVNTCTNTPLFIILISVAAASLNSYQTYKNWYQNIMLMMEAKRPHVQYSTKVSIATSDFIVHLLCTILSFWWVDDLHECIPLKQQGVAWFVILLLAMVLHIIQYHVKHRRMEEVIRDAYRHVQGVV